MEIRIINKWDSESYQKLRLSALKVAPEFFGSTYEKEVEFTNKEIIARICPTSDKFFIGAFDGNKLVGMVSFHREPGEKTRHKGGIYGMFIHPSFQNKGLGKVILNRLIDRIRNQYPEIEQISLSVVSDNVYGIRLYKSLGFIKYGVEKNALKQGKFYWDEDLMVLFLQ